MYTDAMPGFEIGDIIRFTSVPFHYAVYIGDGEIVHYNTRPNRIGKTLGEVKVGIVRETLKSLQEKVNQYKLVLLTINLLLFNIRAHIPSVSEAKVTYKLSGKSKSPSQIKERALRYVDKENYNLLLRNCEHFATWCVYGKAVSGNSRAAVAGAGVAGTTAVGTGGGVAIGALVGSVVPVAGTIVGGVVGGFIGTGVGLATGLVGAGLGLGITMIVYDVKEESEEFE